MKRVRAQRGPADILEVVGPPGIGKTTLIKHCLVRLDHDAALSDDVSVGSAPVDPQLKDVFETLFSGALRRIASADLSLQTRVDAAMTYSEVMQREWGLRRRADGLHLLEAGFCQLYCEELAALPPGDLARVLDGRKLVFMATGDPAATVERIRRRRETAGYALAWDWDATEDTISRAVSEKSAGCARLIESAARTGVPVLQIDGEADPGENARRVLGFLVATAPEPGVAAPEGQTHVSV